MGSREYSIRSFTLIDVRIYVYMYVGVYVHLTSKIFEDEMESGILMFHIIEFNLSFMSIRTKSYRVSIYYHHQPLFLFSCEVFSSCGSVS